MVRVQCPHCQRRYRTEIGAFGRIAVCSKCAQTFKIGSSRPPFQWKATDLAEDSWIGVPPPEEKQETKHCIICDAPLRPETFRCPECGANQITGVVHRAKPVTHEDKPPFWSVIPLRLIGVLLGLALVGAGIYWLVTGLTRKTIEAGQELADNAIVVTVAKEVREGRDESDIRRQRAGYVTDANLDRFLTGLSAENAHYRRAAVLLIGAGAITRLDPLLQAASSPDARISEPARETLAAIGPRRLLELTNHEKEGVRTAATAALARLFDLPPADPKVAQLAQSAGLSQKKTLLNDLCRPWPYLAGDFVVRAGAETSAFTVHMEQVGKSFYLTIGPEEFRSSLASRRFEIPLHRWCAATGAAVDAQSVRQILSGTLVLESPVGAAWEGDLEITAKRRITGPLPGFPPIKPPEPGQTSHIPVRLERPARQSSP